MYPSTKAPEFHSQIASRGKKKVREKTRRHRGKQHQHDARVAMKADSKKRATTNEGSGERLGGSKGPIRRIGGQHGRH